MRYRVTLTGAHAGMLMHADDVAGADALSAYRSAAKGKGKQKSVAGDDRTPPWSYWIYLQHDGERLCLTGLQLSAMLMKGGAEFKMSGRRGRSLKAATQTLIHIADPSWPLMVKRGKTMKEITVAEIRAIGEDATFDEHISACAKLGFLLDVRRASVGQSKHVRVRPRFDAGWTASGLVNILDDDLISRDTFAGILEYCGDFVGIGDWRPSAPKKPGPHGRFTVEVVPA